MLSQDIKVGGSYTWSFQFSGNPPPKVIWSTDTDIDITNNEKFYLSKDDYKTSLTIKNVTRKVIK